MTTSVLNRFGINYTIVSPQQVRTIDMKEGTLVHNLQPGVAANYGNASMPVESFNAILSLAGIANLTLAAYGSMAGSARVDSMLRSAYLTAAPHTNGLQVPLAFIGGDAHGSYTASGTYAVFSGSIACTLGVDVSTPFNDGNSSYMQGIESPGSRKIFWPSGQFLAPIWKATTGAGVGVRGFRTLLAMERCNFNYYPRIGVSSPWWPDSTLTPEQSDTLCAWQILFSNISGSQQACFALVDGPGGADDSATSGQVPGEGDVAVITYLVAHLDSLAGHTLIDYDKMPLKLGVTVDAGFCRTSNRAGPGILPSDSSVFKATLDSLAALNLSGGVPVMVTAGINVDSLQSGSYASELGWWRKLGANVRFSPQAWRQVKTLSNQSGDGNTSDVLPADIFGFRRSRTFYGGGGYFGDDGAAEDSSIDAHLFVAGNLMNVAGIRHEEMSHTLLPALDDWTPTNKSSGIAFDSLMFVANRNGYWAIRADNRSWASAISNNRNGTAASSMTPWGISGTGALGYVDKPGCYKSSLGQLNVLCQNGYPILGGVSMDLFAGADSARAVGSVGDSSSWYEPFIYEVDRSWTGLMLNEMRNSDFNHVSGQVYEAKYAFNAEFSFYRTEGDKRMPLVDGQVVPKAAQIRKFNIADLSGVPNGPPARHGYWTLKSLKNSFDAINSAAGKTLFRFAWPEDMRPYSP